MNQQSHTRSPEHTAEPHDRHARDEGRTLRGKRMVGEILRGGVFSAVAYLFGSATVVFGAAPLGIALLAAASSYTWYILAGLLLAAILHPASLVTWAWVGVYLFCIVLRLCIRFFVDPPTVGDGRPLGGRAYLRLCFSSVLRNIGFGESEDDDTSTDYYDGEGRARTSSHTSTGAARPSTRGEEMHLFAEHPFLRMLTAAVGGFAAGVISLFSGHFHVYDLLTLFSFIILSPLATFLLVSCFGESGQILLFSPTPLRDAPLRSASVRGKSLSDRDGGVGQLGAHFHALPLLSVCFLLAAAVFAARERSVALGTPYLTLELATILGLMFSLLASARLGVIPGVAVAILCGLAADPRLSPVFILCAGGYALLRYISHSASALHRADRSHFLRMRKIVDDLARGRTAHRCRPRTGGLHHHGHSGLDSRDPRRGTAHPPQGTIRDVWDAVPPLFRSVESTQTPADA